MWIYEEIYGKYAEDMKNISRNMKNYVANMKEIFELSPYIEAMGLGKILSSAGSGKIPTSPALGLGKNPRSVPLGHGGANRRCESSCSSSSPMYGTWKN